MYQCPFCPVARNLKQNMEGHVRLIHEEEWRKGILVEESWKVPTA